MKETANKCSIICQNELLHLNGGHWENKKKLCRALCADWHILSIYFSPSEKHYLNIINYKNRQICTDAIQPENISFYIRKFPKSIPHITKDCNLIDKLNADRSIPTTGLQGRQVQ